MNNHRRNLCIGACLLMLGAYCATPPASRVDASASKTPAATAAPQDVSEPVDIDTFVAAHPKKQPAASPPVQAPPAPAKPGATQAPTCGPGGCSPAQAGCADGSCSAPRVFRVFRPFGRRR